jgi:hypothetical protein
VGDTRSDGASPGSDGDDGDGATPSLLAVDLGLTAGFAVYGSDGRLRSFRSQNFGKRSRFKAAAWGIAAECEELACVVVEGDRSLASIWEKIAARRDARFEWIDASVWRERLLHRRERRSGAQAKEHAIERARQIVDASECPGRDLRHDTAEAILIGMWGVLEMGWREESP